MCVSWKNTLIRIINELWVEKIAVAAQTGIIWGRNTCHPLPGRTLHEKPNGDQVWRTPLPFVTHKVVIILKEGTSTPDPETSLEDNHSWWNIVPLAGAHPATDLPWGTEPAAWFCHKIKLPGQSIHLRMLSPGSSQGPAPVRDLFFKKIH